ANPNEEGYVKVLAPPYTKPKDRHGTQRRRDDDEGGNGSKALKYCGKCWATDHYRSTYNGLTAEEISERER
ncbi:hypothetical protein MKX01_023042, partial [Papaver californicum]